MKRIIIGFLGSTYNAHPQLLWTLMMWQLCGDLVVSKAEAWTKAVVRRFWINIKSEKEARISRLNKKDIRVRAGMFCVGLSVSLPSCLCICQQQGFNYEAQVMCAHTHTQRKLASHISLTQCLTVPLTNQWHQTLACGSLIPVNVLLCNS